MRKRLSVVALVAVATLSGCAVVVQVDDTRVKAQNNLTDLTVTVGTSSIDVDYVDLYDVTVGDVLFTLVEAGTTTPYAVTGSSGNVDVLIDQANVTTILGETPIYDIDPMSAPIAAGTDNTVVFDQNTAAVVFSALGKSLAK